MGLQLKEHAIATCLLFVGRVRQSLRKTRSVERSSVKRIGNVLLA